MKKNTLVKTIIILPGILWLTRKIEEKIVKAMENTLDWADDKADYFFKNIEPRMPKWMKRK